MNDTRECAVAETEGAYIGTGDPERKAQAKANVSPDKLPVHRFPTKADVNNNVRQEKSASWPRRGSERPCDFPNKSLCNKCGASNAVYDEEHQRRIYRGRTVAMLRRYMRYSIETGRLPSLLGRELFRSTVTSYRVTTFEDRVIFVHDMDTCLQKLDDNARDVLGRIVLQEYGHEDAARLLGCTRMTVHRRLVDALDWLSAVLLEVGLLGPLLSNPDQHCQEPASSESRASERNNDK